MDFEQVNVSWVCVASATCEDVMISLQRFQIKLNDKFKLIQQYLCLVSLNGWYKIEKCHLEVPCQFLLTNETDLSDRITFSYPIILTLVTPGCF